MNAGNTVRISDQSSAELQRGLTGVLLDGDDPRGQGDVMVRLQPNAQGVYGGEYWFPPSDIEQATPDAGAKARE